MTKTMKWFLASLFIVVALVLPATASADDGSKDNEGLIVRVTGDVTVAKDQTVSALVVIDGTATIEGTVTESLTVISGTAIISGVVRHDVTVISGTLDLRSGAAVENVNLISSDFLRADDVVITGKIDQHDGFEVPAGVLAALSVYFWLAMTLTVIVAGIVFAAVGGHQLNEATRVFAGEPAHTAIGAAFLWAGMPILAVLAMLTLVGIPLGLGVLLVVLPGLWFLGYIVAGAWLGKIILRNGNPEHPIAATTLGIVLLQASLLMPVIGGLIAFLAGTWGAGTIAYLAYRSARGNKAGTSSPTAPIGTTASLAM